MHFVLQRSDLVFVVAHLIPQLAILELNVPQPIHFDLYLIKLTRSTEVAILGPIGLCELFSEHLDFLLSTVRPIALHPHSVLSRSFFPLCHLNDLRVVLPLLCSLKLKSTSLLIKLSLDAVTLFSETLCVGVFSLLAVAGILVLKPFCLMLHPLLYFLFNGTFTGDRFLLHSSLHLFKFELEVFLLRHELFVVAIVREALIVAKLCLHTVGESFETLLVFKS